MEIRIFWENLANRFKPSLIAIASYSKFSLKLQIQDEQLAKGATAFTINRR